MTALIVATHSTFCLGIKEGGEFVSGEHKNAFFIQLDNNGVETFQKNLMELIETVHKTYDSILFLTDLKNATPYNQISGILFSGAYPNDRLLSGVNLAMYIEAALSSEILDDIDELAESAVFAGRASIAKLENMEILESADDDDL